MSVFTALKSYNTQQLERTDVFQRIERKLKQEKFYKYFLDSLEKSSKINRVYIVAGFSFLVLSSLLYHFGNQFICGAVGLLYPGYQTVSCLENFDVNEGKRWLMYWLIFSAFLFVEKFLFFLHWLPGYLILKCAFFIWCYIPFPPNGSVVTYNFLIRPFFKKNQEVIDDAIHQIMNTAHTICNNADNLARNEDERLPSHQD